LQDLAALPGAAARAACAMLRFFNQRRMAVYGCGEDEMSLNDPCVIAYLLAPGLFSGRQVNIAIEHQSMLTMGSTVVDRRGVSGRPPNALWLEHVDAPRVLRLVWQTLAGFSG
jgi:purine nucleosidase